MGGSGTSSSRKTCIWACPGARSPRFWPARNLPSTDAFANAPALLIPIRSEHVFISSASAQGRPPYGAASRPPKRKPEVAVPPGIPEESRDGWVDHPVEPRADRQDAGSGRLGEYAP